MKTIKIPAYLHEVFGERQTAGHIAAIVLFGAGMTAVWCAVFPSMLTETAPWRTALALLLIFDVCAGCIANFTPSTSNYYALRRKHRLVFIAVHVHVLLIAWLLEQEAWHAIAVWGYTVVGATIVNALIGRPSRTVIAAWLLAAGMSGILMLPGISIPMAIAYQLFLLKVLYGFAVDHYGRSEPSR